MIDDYVIAVRTYARSKIFPKKTYQMLLDNGLTDRLYIFVASLEEKQLYEEAVTSYKAMIIGEKGGAQAIRAICDYFPPGQRIVFMDDDLERFRPGNLDLYLNDGFRTIDEHACGAFTFSFISNGFWLRHKPFKEFRPFTLAGNFFCTRNDPDMITTTYSHGDDLVRSVRYLERYGGVLVYWAAGFVTHYGTEPGGMQASGDRGTPSESLAKTEEISWLSYKACPLLQAYASKPAQDRTNLFVSMKMKTLPAVRKAMKKRGVFKDRIVWPTDLCLYESAKKTLDAQVNDAKISHL